MKFPFFPCSGATPTQTQMERARGNRGASQSASVKFFAQIVSRPGKRQELEIFCTSCITAANKRWLEGRARGRKSFSTFSLGSWRSYPRISPIFRRATFFPLLWKKWAFVFARFRWSAFPFSRNRSVRHGLVVGGGAVNEWQKLDRCVFDAVGWSTKLAKTINLSPSNGKSINGSILRVQFCLTVVTWMLLKRRVVGKGWIGIWVCLENIGIRRNFAWKSKN